MLILSLSLEGKSNKAKPVIHSFGLQFPSRYDSVLSIRGCLICPQFLCRLDQLAAPF